MQKQLIHCQIDEAIKILDVLLNTDVKCKCYRYGLHTSWHYQPAAEHHLPHQRLHDLVLGSPQLRGYQNYHRYEIFPFTSAVNMQKRIKRKSIVSILVFDTLQVLTRRDSN